MKRLILLVVATASCRVPAVDGAAYSGPRNGCDQGCAVDASCTDGACIATQTAYPLVFEVTSHLGSVAGVTFTMPIADHTGTLDRKLTLGEPVRVYAELDATAGVTLRLRRVDAVAGAASGIYEASSLAGSKTTRAAVVPPGDYEVFVAPTSANDLTVLPPVQLRDDDTGLPLVETFSSGPPQKLVVTYASLRTLTVALTDKDGKALTKEHARDLFVLDDTTGQLASTIAHTCKTLDTVLPEVSLTLAPTLSGHRYTLRSAPSATSCSSDGKLPLVTVDFDLQALDVEGHGNRAVLPVPTATTGAFPALNVVGQVLAYGTGAAINEASILLHSQTLDPSITEGTSGHSFVELRGDVGGSDGRFFIENVVPGTYRGTVIPGSGVTLGASPYAICVDCTVTAQPAVAGAPRIVEFKLDAANSKIDFQIARKVAVTVAAAGFDKALFGLGTYDAYTSSSTSLFAATGSTLVTRGSQGAIAITQEKGTSNTWNVSAAVDPGAYDLVIRTPTASGYPWIVLPRLDVAPSPKLDIGMLQATAPVMFAGKVVDSNGNAVPRAAIRARGLIADKTDPKKPPLGAVLVGETQSDEHGDYRIAVPSDFASQPVTMK